jgi:general secretion pathway protein K
VLLNRDQAVQVALGAESWVNLILKEDLQDTQTDHLGEIWAADLPGLPIEGGDVVGTIEDLQGRFNVNNLLDNNGNVDQEQLEQFRRLLNALGLDPRFAGFAVDWIDRDQNASFPDGAEDGIYTAFTPPYRPPNLALTSASEMAALEGMDKETFDVLAPHIVALPDRTGINVNTATPFVLQSLDENIGTDDVERLIAARESAGFSDVKAEFGSLVAPDVLNSLEESSTYFQLKVVVRIDTVRVTLYSTLFRSSQGDTVAVARSFGTP